MRFPLLAVAVGLAVLALSFAIGAQTEDKMEVARDVAARVGQIVGGAGACRDINPVRIKSMSDKLQAVLSFATNSPVDLKALKQVYEKNLADGQRAVTSRRQDCGAVERDLAELENATRTPSSSTASASTGAASPAGTVAPNRSVANPIVAAAPVAAPARPRRRGLSRPIARWRIRLSPRRRRWRRRRWWRQIWIPRRCAG